MVSGDVFALLELDDDPDPGGVPGESDAGLCAESAGRGGAEEDRRRKKGGEREAMDWQ